MTAGLAPRARIVVSGVTLAAEVSRHVLSVQYDNNLDLADMFTIVLDNAGNRFTDSPLFDLGKSVEIHLGYGDDLHPMMLGEITALQPSFPQSGAPTLTVSGYDRSHRLRHDVPDRPAFKFMNDSMIAAQIAVEAGLIPVVDPSLFFHTKLRQTGTDMALLKERARANFFEVYVWWDRLYFRLPRPQAGELVLEWGRNLTSFNPRLSSAALAGIQVVRGYNEELAQTIVGVMTGATVDLDAVVERLGGTALDMLLGLGRRVVRDKPVKSPVDAFALAKSILQEILEGMYEASGSCPGLPDLRADQTVAVRGVGRRFSGGYRLRRVTHTLDGGGYRTDFEVTQRAASSLLQLVRRSVVDQPSPNRPEPSPGVAIGTVESVNPLTYQAEVAFPWFSDSGETTTAACATPMAGAGSGAFFLPDPGDQVVVAFEQGDFGRPVVIGSLWDQLRGKPVTTLDGTNSIRRIRTKAGHTITLDDSTAAEQIVIEDRAGSTVTLAADGTVSITAMRDIELNAAGEIRLNAIDVKVKVANRMDVS
ncbi:phage baseplate assembly protein V [Phytohabitans sp. LJ34]|uniref:phage late control D family protein n=1 Tax=Phytohabitans sp. LJ34 TaxID=3452217 RepID=UPI003F8A604B